jgi:hypothetical protein
MNGVGSDGLGMLTLAKLAFLVKTRAASRKDASPTLRIPAGLRPVPDLDPEVGSSHDQSPQCDRNRA